MHKIYEVKSVSSSLPKPKSELQREYLFRGSVESIGSNISYKDKDGNTVEFVLIGEGPGELIWEDGTVINPDEYGKEETGYTDPNLHRRIDPQSRELPELSPREYILSIQGTNSYRLTKLNYHDEDNTGKLIYDDNGVEIDISEIP